MNEKDLISLNQVAQFLDGTQAVAFKVLSNKDDRYKLIQRTLIRFEYEALKRRDKGPSCSTWSRSAAIHANN